MAKHAKPNAKLGVQGITSLIGNTPLLKVDGVYAKLETVNPSGSIKDRMAWAMVRKAEAKGLLKPGSKIIECTSGNTGIAFAMLSALRGYKFTAVLPKSMSIERLEMMKDFGAEVILTKGSKDMLGAWEKYGQIVAKHPKAWLPRQFENTDNVEEHRKGIGREIIRQMKGLNKAAWANQDRPLRRSGASGQRGSKQPRNVVGAFVAGIGTGGTIIGVAKALQDAGLKAQVVGIEPAESAVISGGKPGHHRIEGIGEGFVPKIVKENLGLIDRIVKVKSLDAIRAAKLLASKHGLLVGVSSGANYLVAQMLRKEGVKNVVTVFPDRGERYLSSELYPKSLKS